MQELGYVEIETRIVDQYHDIGLPFHDVTFAERHVLENGGQMKQHWDEAHICQIAVMAHERATLRLHQVATEETKLGLGVVLPQRAHEA